MDLRTYSEASVGSEASVASEVRFVGGNTTLDPGIKAQSRNPFPHYDIVVGIPSEFFL